MMEKKVRIIVKCSRCGGTVFFWNDNVHGSYGYCCVKCNQSIGDDCECFPLSYEEVR